MTNAKIDQPDSQKEQKEEAPPTLSEEMQELLKEIRSRSRRLTRAANMLKDLARKEPDAADYEAWLELHKGLDGYDLELPALNEGRQRVVDLLEKELPRMRTKARMKFLTTLEMLATQEELKVERISESPLVLYLKPLTLEVDFDGGGARLLFGHEPISELPINARSIMEERKKILAGLKKEALSSEDFFPLLKKAYQSVLAREGAEFGARVDLVDVTIPLSMLLAKPRDLRRRGIDALKPYPRELLVWQLARLRQDGMLQVDGLRLDLGAATGGSTKNKEDVLFIPVGPSSGQYYGSLRFERTG